MGETGNLRVAVGIAEFEVPGLYRHLDSMPEDPVGSVVFGTQTGMAQAFVICRPVVVTRTMPYHEVDVIVSEMHRAMDDQQGLVEVLDGVTESGFPYVATIIKSQVGQTGLQYVLTMHIGTTPLSVEVQGFFDEAPMTGIRASVMFAKLQGEGKVSVDVDSGRLVGWAKDPYDPDRTEGFLMNLGEGEEYDGMFPEHPLSLARGLVRGIVASVRKVDLGE